MGELGWDARAETTPLPLRVRGEDGCTLPLGRPAAVRGDEDDDDAMGKRKRIKHNRWLGSRKKYYPMHVQKALRVMQAPSFFYNNIIYECHRFSISLFYTILLYSPTPLIDFFFWLEIFLRDGTEKGSSNDKTNTHITPAPRLFLYWLGFT